MVDKEKIQKKINLQKTKNIICKIEGIQVIDYEEEILFDEEYLQKINYFNSEKTSYTYGYSSIDDIYNNIIKPLESDYKLSSK